jgi:murein DD-endopeptidase MepM/ murein hydrolase activator NlpD
MGARPDGDGGVTGRRGGGRLLALAALAALGACSRGPRPSAAPAPRPAHLPGAAAHLPGEDAVRLRARGLAVPVLGVYPDQIPDSYNAGRSGGRTHNAVDILAPRGTPVLSADDGQVARLSRNALGGITVYAFDPGRRFVYYYAHLDRYRAGLAEGMRLAKGEVIGYVGTTGNAPPGTPHLHFQVMRVGEGRQWWAGSPLDPRPYFVTGGIER